ncbi:hypothetical protein GOODEAATRI_006192, partial [Goodea atripinnis]
CAAAASHATLITSGCQMRCKVTSSDAPPPGDDPLKPARAEHRQASVEISSNPA